MNYNIFVYMKTNLDINKLTTDIFLFDNNTTENIIYFKPNRHSKFDNTSSCKN